MSPAWDSPGRGSNGSSFVLFLHGVDTGVMQNTAQIDETHPVQLQFRDGSASCWRQAEQESEPPMPKDMGFRSHDQNSLFPQAVLPEHRRRRTLQSPPRGSWQRKLPKAIWVPLHTLQAS